MCAEATCPPDQPSSEGQRKRGRARLDLRRIGRAALFGTADRDRLPDALAHVAEVHRAHYPDADLEPLRRAYVLAESSHRGQMRKSGEPYITHPLAVTLILAELGAETTTLTASLLHDTVEDTEVTLDQVRDAFGEEVRYLVDGVTKLEKVDYGAAAEPETFRKMLVATGNDVRVMSIKLADRLHNMRTLGVMRPEKQARIAKVTRDVLIPLAERLGVQALKTELEDLVFAILHPEEYEATRALIAAHAASGHDPLAVIAEDVRAVLREARINAHVVIRPRHFVSLYRTRLKRGEARGGDFGRLLVLVTEDADCYGVLGELHTCFTPVISEFKDFIAVPKFNLYQSLHTAVAVPDGEVAEVLIRTHQMHRTAEAGVIALGNPYAGAPAASGAGASTFTGMGAPASAGAPVATGASVATAQGGVVAAESAAPVSTGAGAAAAGRASAGAVSASAEAEPVSVGAAPVSAGSASVGPPAPGSASAGSVPAAAGSAVALGPPAGRAGAWVAASEPESVVPGASPHVDGVVPAVGGPLAVPAGAAGAVEVVVAEVWAPAELGAGPERLPVAPIVVPADDDALASTVLVPEVGRGASAGAAERGAPQRGTAEAAGWEACGGFGRASAPAPASAVHPPSSADPASPQPAPSGPPEDYGTFVPPSRVFAPGREPADGERTDPTRPGWLSRLLAWQQAAPDSDTFWSTLREDLAQDREITVFRSDGGTLGLPAGASCVDAAYALYGEDGHACIGARVNGRLATLSTVLRDGDTVQLLMAHDPSSGPSRAWLDHAHTPAARIAIARWLASHPEGAAPYSGHLEDMPLGDMPSGGPRSDAGRSGGAQPHARHAESTPPQASEGASPRRDTPRTSARTRGVRPAAANAVVDLPGATVRLAGCCTPVPPDGVTAFAVRGGVVTVHRLECTAVARMKNAGRAEVGVRWGEGAACRVTLFAESFGRPRLLADLTEAIAVEGAAIVSAKVEPPSEQRVRHTYTLQLPNAACLPDLMRAMRNVPGVYDVSRAQRPTAFAR